jgi:hypothetical protein
MLWYIELDTIPLYRFVPFTRVFLADVDGSLRVSCIKPVSKTAYITTTPFSSDSTDKKEDCRMGGETKNENNVN